MIGTSASRLLEGRFSGSHTAGLRCYTCVPGTALKNLIPCIWSEAVLTQEVDCPSFSNLQGSARAFFSKIWEYACRGARNSRQPQLWPESRRWIVKGADL